jgi:Tfp pilus assembly protein PilW
MERLAGRGGLLKRVAGTSLVELMIGMSISIVMMGAVVMAIQTQSKSSGRETDRVDLIHNLQNAALRLEKDLLMAGYQTVDSSALYTGAITAANANSITFVYDTDGSTLTGDAKGRETVSFRLDTVADVGYNAAHPRLLRVDAVGIRSIATDICANTAVPCGAAGVTFTYYDSLGVVTAVLDDIRSVKITINGRSPRINRDTGAYRQGSFTIRVTPRNLG